MGVIAVLSAVAVPAVRTIRDRCCIKAAVLEISEMIREARLKALGENDYAVAFVPEIGKVSLLSGKGPDGRWNTSDDIVVRTLWLSSKGAGLHFGYGSYGPIAGLTRDSDNDGLVLSTPQRVVCNTGLSGSSGSIYLITGSGIAMAIVVDTTEIGSDIWQWDGTKWVQIS